MKHRFAIADVFTDRPFAGNQLAVFPRADEVPEAAMQRIAREFNFPETTFVLRPRDPRNAARVRIFTPKAELPFAGHPTIGTTAVLTQLGIVTDKRFVLEEGVGPIELEVEQRSHLIHARFAITTPVEMAAERPSLPACAAALSLPPEDVVEAWFANGGVRFCFIRLKSRDAVDRAVLDRAAWSREFSRAWAPSLYMLALEDPIYVRMFAPALGVEEDPATGSGAVALAGVLAAREPATEGIFARQILQGVAMGRPSRLETRAEKRGGRVMRIIVGGDTVVVAEGEMEVPTSLP